MALKPEVVLKAGDDRDTTQWRALRFAVYCSIYLLWLLLIFLATRQAGASGESWLSGWRQWDASWYEQIWREGYPAADPRTLVFPPGFPFAIGVLSRVLSRSFLATAVIVNLAAFFATVVLIAEWLSRKFHVSAYLLFLFGLSAPAAYFAFTAYSDVLFMLLLWGLLWFVLRADAPSGYRETVAQCCLLFVLPWIRLTGYALTSWLFARRFAALTILASLALWLRLNHAIAGNAFYFLHAQELFAMPAGNFFQGLTNSLIELGRGWARVAP